MAFPIQWNSLRCSSEKDIFIIDTSDVAQSRRSPPLAKIKRISKGNVAAIAAIFATGNRRTSLSVVRSSTNTPIGRWEKFLKPLPTSSPCLSDVLWPSAGAFAVMAALGRLDMMVAHRGISFTTAPLGAVCAVLFSAPNSPSAQKYNMFVAQIGCAAIGVLALSIFGPGWLARATALAASLAFMTVTGSIHPPAASLPILFIDGAKFHNLNLWKFTKTFLPYIFQQEMVTFLKKNCRF